MFTDARSPDLSIGEHNAAVLRFVEAFAADRAALIDNVSASVEALDINGRLLPVTLDSTSGAESFVTSARSGVVSYPRFEARPADWVTRAVVWSLTSAFDLLLSASRLDRAVQANNWLTTTAFPPHDLDPAHLRNQMAERWPDRPLVMRGLVDGIDDQLASRFRQAGWSLITLRQVWLVDPADPGLRRIRNVSRDRALLSRRPFVARSPVTEADWIAAAALYRQLYIGRYGPLNPGYRPGFLRLMHDIGAWRVTLLEEAGESVGMYATTSRQGWRTSPVAGYDLSRPRGEGLYRRLMAHIRASAEGGGSCVHESSGAGAFKSNRGARPSRDWAAVYLDHLPLHPRICGRLLIRVINACVDRLYARLAM